MTEEALRAALRANKELSVDDSLDAPRSPIEVELSREKTKLLQRQFDDLWRQLGGHSLVEEYRFHPVRRWRLDRAQIDVKVGIEINGGVWTKGRHTRGVGYLKDREKINAASAMGWTIFELGTGMITVPHVQMIIDAIAERMRKND